MSITLRVEDVSKCYRVYDRPADWLKESLSGGLVKRHREYWALRNISFEVQAGTTTGVIGPNGCGKSTLLQIVTGTLEATSGTVWKQGRVAALLELGAGFNPECTGLENVYLYGAVMGFTHDEITEKLDGIRRFAEIGEHLYQPVKTYSSGMYVRLAFAVAVSIEPDILIVDEALSVGDAIFQHRCIRRIKEMQQRGVTILFVSHDPGAIRALCNHAILINSGRMVHSGDPIETLQRYQDIVMQREETFDEAELDAKLAQSQSSSDSGDSSFTPDLIRRAVPLRAAYRHGNGLAEVISIDVFAADRRETEIIETGASLLVRVRVLFHRACSSPVIGLQINNRNGIPAYGVNTDLLKIDFGTVGKDEIIETAFNFDCWLGQDNYTITVAVHSLDGTSYDWLDGVKHFRVVSPILTEGVANLNASVSTRRVTAERGAVGGSQWSVVGGQTK